MYSVAREAVLDQATCEEPAQHALDEGAERAVLLGEALRIDAQELLEVLLGQPEERELPRPPRPVHPRTDLHATPRAGGRDRRASRRRAPCAAGIGSREGPASRQVRRQSDSDRGNGWARASVWAWTVAWKKEKSRLR
jgi:hypothetical protein